MFDISGKLNGLVVDGGEPRLFAKQKTVNLNSHDVIFVPQQLNKRKEYLI